MITRDEILKMAREAGFVDESFCRWGAYTDDLERFAALVAAAEREACAKHFERLCGTEWFAENVADEIRARGEK